jgi:hypothetical protein
MTTTLNLLKSVISDNEILLPSQTVHIKGGADGDDLRRNSLLRTTSTTTTPTTTTKTTTVVIAK